MAFINAVLFKSIYGTVLSVLVLLVIILQVLAIRFRWKYSLGTNALIVLTLAFFIYFLNLSNLLMSIGLSTALPSHHICEWGYFYTQFAYGMTRFLSLLFLLQRARLAHSMTPLFSEFYFKRIFPFLVTMIWVVLCVTLFISPGVPGRNVRNGTHKPKMSSNHCEANQQHHSQQIFLAAALAVTIVVVFFIFLFLYPIIKLIQQNENGSSMASINETPCDGIKLSQTEFRVVLKWSLFLSTLSLSISLLTMTVWPLFPNRLFFIPHLDYFVDSVCTFLLLGLLYDHSLCVRVLYLYTYIYKYICVYIFFEPFLKKKKNVYFF
ncbi:hypothetical protein RFI_21276 [Reticulomyxa filosa]|uniref:G-protein coupled receptors family 1 profile domain-containing protein n=1 Tax=Reticulomyxa filosa TaxID=46433 RepID=X6MQZ9_RETFI|nr:hypothetical protein RFI_21276 [Reticulomyxa filosa]|eukprot:ETO16086.1 hypothetical protein RFI_21276 [Reticulomyxa filosa]